MLAAELDPVPHRAMDENETFEPPPSGSWLRRGIIGVLVVCAIVFAASRVFYFVPGLNLLSERGRHDRRLTMISHQMGLTMTAIRGSRSANPADWPGADDRARYYLIAAMQKALWNLMLRPEDVVPEKWRAVHARLEATDYEDLNSVKGCWEIFGLFEEVSPTFRTYSPVLEVYDLQAQGVISAPKK